MIVRNSLMYLGIEFLVKIVPFISLPIIIGHLSKNEYGKFSLYLSLLPLLSVLLDISFRSSIKNFYFEYKRQISHYLQFSLVLVTIMAIGMVFLLNYFNVLIVDGVSNNLIILTVYFFTLIEQLLSYYQISKQVSQYSFTYFFKTAFPYFAYIFLIFFFYSKMIFYIYIQMFVFFILIVYLVMKLKLYVIRLMHFQKYLKYGLSLSIPLLPAVFSAFALSASDRLIISHYFGYEAVAIYSLAYTIASIVSMFFLAIGQAWQPFIFENLKNNKIMPILKMSVLYTSSVLLLITFIYLFKEFLVDFFGNSNYHESSDIIGILLIGIFGFFLYSMISSILFYYKKIFPYSLALFFAGSVNLILNYIFIPLYGYKAAAYTTSIAYWLEFLIVAFLAFKTLKQKGLI